MKFTRQAAGDLEFWKRSNPATVKRIKLLLDDIEVRPFSGLGKPEALKGTSINRHREERSDVAIQKDA